ncbi:hypothetical protein [Bradyrhizobium sp. SZCCHNRI2007]|uniref:hypothetical protein n=1 Tax=Bradyrhizobium sp. SZCCHNRI2007 TaxID=3057281 RepID=UPI0028E4324B|nr:hypothetical protein [Bradyrhizobium sp. SZCCHNRI2007]
MNYASGIDMLRLWTATFAAIIGSASLASEPDPLIQAVSFATTGTNGTDISVIDRTHCIFKIGNDTIYFNNVYIDRIALKTWSNKLGNVWTTVDIHGRGKVVDHYAPPLTYTGSEFDKALIAADPDYFSSRTAQITTGSDFTFTVRTTESTRLARAWKFIYANGCKGIRSPF